MGGQDRGLNSAVLVEVGIQKMAKWGPEGQAGSVEHAKELGLDPGGYGRGH